MPDWSAVGTGVREDPWALPYLVHDQLKFFLMGERNSQLIVIYKSTEKKMCISLIAWQVLVKSWSNFLRLPGVVFFWASVHVRTWAHLSHTWAHWVRDGWDLYGGVSESAAPYHRLFESLKHHWKLKTAHYVSRLLPVFSFKGVFWGSDHLWLLFPWEPSRTFTFLYKLVKLRIQLILNKNKLLFILTVPLQPSF